MSNITASQNQSPKSSADNLLKCVHCSFPPIHSETVLFKEILHRVTLKGYVFLIDNFIPFYIFAVFKNLTQNIPVFVVLAVLTN